MSRSLTRSPAVKILGYLAVTSALLLVLSQFVPELWNPRGAITGTDNLGEAISNAENSLRGQLSYTDAAIRGLLALISALVFAIPVTWMYSLTTRRQGYDTSFVRMMIGLPVVVAGVVQIVRGDIALAFALTGIVAAVRFRTTLRDLQNAVNAFAVIAIGLAAGIGAWSLAAVIAFVFTGVSFSLWKLKIGSVESGLEDAIGGSTLAEVLVPGEPHRAVVIGDKKAVGLVHLDDQRMGEAIDRLAGFVRADALRKKKKYNTLLLVYTPDAENAIREVEPILEEHSRRWIRVDEIDLDTKKAEGPPTRSTAPSVPVVVTFLIRLKKEVDVGTMVHQLQDRGCVTAVELKPIRGLRKRLT